MTGPRFFWYGAEMESVYEVMFVWCLTQGGCMNIGKLIESRQKSISQIEAQLADYDARIEQLADPLQRTQLRNIASTWRARVTKLRSELVALQALSRVPAASSKQVDLEELVSGHQEPPAPGPVMGKGKPPRG